MSTNPNTIQQVSDQATPAGGATPYPNNTIVNTGVAVKPAPGRLFSIHAYNANAALRYLKFYDKAAPTASDTPVLRIPLPASGTLPPMSFPKGIKFTVAIGIRVTTGAADNDNTAPTVGETILNLSYS